MKMAQAPSSMWLPLARSLRDQLTRLKDVEGILQHLEAFVFGAIKEDLLVQHPANQEAAACPKETEAAQQSQTHV